MRSKRVLALATAVFFVFAPAAIPQTPTLPAKDNLYSLALQASILEMEKEWGHLGHYGGIPTDYRRMIVQRNAIITDGLPTTFENHSVDYLDDQGLIDHYHNLNSSFEILQIGPIRNEGATLKVVVSTYWVSYKKHRLLLGYSDWSEVEFRYDCEKGAFAITSVKLGGI
jgi:hypothetical protein